MSAVDVNALLARLSLSAVNSGTWSGQHGWSKSTEAPLLNVKNPASGALIAQVRPATDADYESVIASASEAASAWRDVPAPRRGELVRQHARCMHCQRGALTGNQGDGLARIAQQGDPAQAPPGQPYLSY